LYRRGQILGAFRDTEMVGVCGVAPPGHCQATLLEKARIFPAVVIGNQARTVVRVLRWAGEWSRRDLSQAHWHLGPVAVEPALQGQGIGHALMAEFCSKMDNYAARSYLETDKNENVEFYRRFGFTIVAEGQVSTVRNWFMSRPAPGAPSRWIGKPLPEA
jgi:GNAT superfamily N-acetyltransferase